METDSYGGAIYASAGAYVTLLDCVVSNSAGDGAAVYIEGAWSEFHVFETTFESNAVTILRVGAEESGHPGVSFEDCDFRDNSAEPSISSSARVELGAQRTLRFAALAGVLAGGVGELWFRRALLPTFPGWTYDVALRTAFDQDGVRSLKH